MVVVERDPEQNVFAIGSAEAEGVLTINPSLGASLYVKTIENANMLDVVLVLDGWMDDGSWDHYNVLGLPFEVLVPLTVLDHMEISLGDIAHEFAMDGESAIRDALANGLNYLASCEIGVVGSEEKEFYLLLKIPGVEPLETRCPVDRFKDFIKVNWELWRK